MENRRFGIFSSCWIATAIVAAGCSSTKPIAERGETTYPSPQRSESSTPGTVETTPALSNSDLDGDSGLSDYLQYAALNNPGLEAAFDRWKAALERIPQVKALPDPRFNYGYFIREVETRVGPQQQRVGIAQTFPWFGKLRLKGEAAGEEANAAYQRYEAAKLNLFYQVKNVYYELYYLGRAIEITEDNIQLLKELERVAQSAVVGGTGVAAVSKAQTELGKLEDRLQTLEDLKGPLTVKFNAALNRPLNAGLAWPDEIQIQETDINEERLEAWMLEFNPELKELEYMEEREERAARLARKDFYPDFTLGLDYTQTDDAVMPGVSDDGKDPLMATVSVNIPLWFGKYRAGVREAAYRRDAYAKSRLNRQNTLGADLEMAQYRLRDAKRKINLFGQTLTPLARQNLSVARRAWESGRSDFLDVIDSERQLLEFQLQAERALTDRAQSLAEIEKLVGKQYAPDWKSNGFNQEN